MNWDSMTVCALMDNCIGASAGATLLHASIGGVIASILSTIGIRKWDKREKRKQLAKEYAANIELFREIERKVRLLEQPIRNTNDSSEERKIKTDEVGNLKAKLPANVWVNQLDRQIDEGETFRILQRLYKNMQRLYDELSNISILRSGSKITPNGVANCSLDFNNCLPQLDSLNREIVAIEETVPVLRKSVKH